MATIDKSLSLADGSRTRAEAGTGQNPLRGMELGQGSGSIWARLPTRTRLVLVVLAIDCLAALLSCAVIVLNARSAVQVEMKAARETVEPLVADTISLARDTTPDALLHTLDLRFQVLRHVRVSVFDAQGRRAGYRLKQREQEGHRAPAWFVSLIEPESQQHELPIDVGNVRIGTAIITTEPLDEIDEVWGYAVRLTVASLVLNLSVLAALYLALGQVLKPLGALAEGLTQLERHDYSARLAPPVSRELAVIAERFNRVAGALSEARAANKQLNRQLLSAQDDERRRIALELHDEFGPCMFALEANAASIARIAEGAAAPDRSKLSARAADMSGIVVQVQTRNRELLNSLRPHALGQVPLAECLNLLVQDFSRRHPGTRFEGHFDALARGYGDIVDLTVFRCVQESMTNAVRHGGARHVRAEVEDLPDGPGGNGSTLRVSVSDDGTGLDPGHRTGLGLSGMRERVEALDGSFTLDNGRPGAVVRIEIPIEPARPDSADPDEPTESIQSPSARPPIDA